MRLIRLFAAVSAVAACSLSAHAQPRLEYLPSGPLFGQYAFARGVSGNGRVIAGSTTHFTGGSEWPFFWRRVAGEWTRFDLPVQGGGGVHGRAIALSYDGDAIVGMTDWHISGSLNYGTPASWSGVLSGAPVLTTPLDDLPPPVPYHGAFGGISSDGTMIAGASGGVGVGFPAALWSYRDGVVTQLSPPPSSSNDWYMSGVLSGNTVSGDASIVVGTRWDGTRRRAFTWTADDGITDLPVPPLYGSSAEVISRDGRVIGGYSPAESGYTGSGGNPTLWTDEGYVPLSTPPGTSRFGRVYALSGDGSIAGGYAGTFGDYLTDTAMLWIDLVPYRLDDFILDLGIDLDGWITAAVTGISDDGRTIVGFARRTEGATMFTSFVLTIPAPASLAALGLAACMFSPRRRRPQ